MPQPLSHARSIALQMLAFSVAMLAALTLPAIAAAHEALPVASAPSPTPTPYPQTLYATNSDLNTGGVYVFDGDKPGPPTSFYAFPAAQSVAVDDEQNIYVSQLDDGSQFPPAVIEAKPGSNGFAYLTDVVSPVGIAVSSGSNAFLLVANDADNPSLNQYGLLVFPQHQNSPTRYSDPNLADIISVLIDGAGATYLGGVNQQGNPEVDAFLPSVGSFDLGLSLTGLPHGLAFDSAGNMLVAESSTGVAIFKPNTQHPSGWIDRGGRPLALAFGNGGHWLYVLDAVCKSASMCSPEVFVYRYPQAASGATIAYAEAPYVVPTTSTSFSEGIAINPRVPLFNPGDYRRTHPGFKYWTDALGRR